MILNNVKIISRCPKKLMEFLHMGNLGQRVGKTVARSLRAILRSQRHPGGDLQIPVPRMPI